MLRDDRIGISIDRILALVKANAVADLRTNFPKDSDLSLIVAAGRVRGRCTSQARVERLSEGG